MIVNSSQPLSAGVSAAMNARSGSREMMNTWFVAGEAGGISLSSGLTGSRPGNTSPPSGAERTQYSNADAAPIFATAGRNVKSAQRSVKAGDDRMVPLERYRHGHREEVTRRQRNFVIEDAADNAAHAPRCVGRHGVRSHPVPVALVGECSIPVV
jgi:hypothetical protein